MTWVRKMGKYFSGFVGLICITIFNACYEPVEGCLDPDALNYNVSADNMCEECCQLPNLNIFFSFRDRERPITLGDTLDLSSGLFIIENFSFFLSDIQFYDQNSKPLIFEDSLRFVQQSTPITIINNFRYFDRMNFGGELKEMRFSGKLTHMKFKVGLPSVMNYRPPDSLRLIPGMGNFPNSVFGGAEAGYRFLSVSLRVPQTTTTINLLVFNEYPLSEGMVVIPDLEVPRGSRVILNVILDLHRWLENVPVMGMANEWKEPLIRNFTQSISFRP
ncbi:MAG TPA: hypothetical protein PKC30_04055 [Saprospiraceae bacterium]|nr:hypothetical protein [Saprospiraceae bacterium]